MYYQYKPEYYYWGLVTLARKFAFAVCELMLRSNAAFQLCAVQLVMFTAYVVQVRCQPFMSTSEFPKVVAKYHDHIKAMEEEHRRIEEAMRESVAKASEKRERAFREGAPSVLRPVASASWSRRFFSAMSAFSASRCARKRSRPRQTFSRTPPSVGLAFVVYVLT